MFLIYLNLQSHLQSPNDVRQTKEDDRNASGTTSCKSKEHGKQRWRTVNGTRTIERTYQNFWFQRRRVERRKASYANRDATKVAKLHPPTSFARFCETLIASVNSQKCQILFYKVLKKLIAPCNSTAKEVSFDWSHHGILSTHSKITSFYNSSLPNCS